MLKNTLTFIFVLLLVSCNNKITFPVSDIAPAANITVKKNKDKYDNYVIEVKAENLASAERISSSSNYFTVWVKNLNDEIRNIGNFQIKNGDDVNIKRTTPFDFKEVFITLDKESNAQHPSGLVVSRTKI